MINQVPSSSPNTDAIKPDACTTEDIWHVIECRLRWYGAKRFVLKDFERESDTRIAVEIADKDRGETYRRVFETSPIHNAAAAGLLAA